MTFFSSKSWRYVQAVVDARDRSAGLISGSFSEVVAACRDDVALVLNIKLVITIM